jgi:hypothetical protein
MTKLEGVFPMIKAEDMVGICPLQHDVLGPGGALRPSTTKLIFVPVWEGK